MVTNNSVRSYEVSVWTLQDSFITVLKPSNLEHQGQITEPNMNLKDDGENKFSFKIPMYIVSDSGEIKENPIWYDTINGNIIANTRKIKVIFNKKQTDEEVFEFVIINVEELHEGNKKVCSVECEGLAFNELGKQGYKISLNGKDDIDNAQIEWAKTGIGPCPQNNINYWADKIFNNSNWRYSIQMDWSASDGVSHQVYTINGTNYDSDDYENFSEEIKNQFNILRTQAGLKRRDIIYEEEYISSWRSSDDKTYLIPAAVQAEQEKYRLLEEKNSNRYNLSQRLAELFQVFCKYKYYYDDNYHIIDREAIFYNNFLNESRGVIDFTYKYNTNNLSRKMDSADLVTKMFVTEISDSDTEIGKCSIMDTEANKNGEDYILNFDYMYKTGTISQEQYAEIEVYQAKLKDINKRYNEKTDELIEKNSKLTDLESKIQTAKDSYALAIEKIGDASAAKEKLDEVSNRPESAPKHLLLKQNSGEAFYYCDFDDKGILSDSLKLYHTYNSINHTVSNQIFSYNLKKDDNGNIVGVTGLMKNTSNQTSIYGVYDFRPNLYYENIIATYGALQKQSETTVNNTTELDSLKNDITILENAQTELIREKENIIADFEKLMGPALREGKWQPEDEYSGYGDLHENEIYTIDMNSQLNNEVLSSFGWDNKLFDEEQKSYYEMGVTLDKYYYPCIKITSALVSAVGAYDLVNKISFIYEKAIPNSTSVKQYMTINSKMSVQFLRQGNGTVIPVLMLEGAKGATDADLDLMKTGSLGLVSFDTSNNQIIHTIKYQLQNNNNYWVISPETCKTAISGEPTYQTVFPRFQILSNTVKSPDTMITIKQLQANNEESLLENYEHFYILSRNSKPYITIKPEVFMRNGLQNNYSYSITYTISTAALAIYLDALKVLQENSYPKVSYEINISSVDDKFTYNAYKRLGQIAHINDYEFKFENVMGYISELDLDLDKPWEDKVVVKNYKTKFEDLFSTIVAETEQMKKNNGVLNTAISYFGSNGNNGLLSELYNSLNDKVDQLMSSNEATLLQKYLEYEPFITAKLQAIFNEASDILFASQDAIDEVRELNISNSNILDSFKENIAKSMTGTLFEDDNSNPPQRKNTKLDTVSTYFKKGDIWHHNNNYYVAIMSSDQVEYDTNENVNTSLKGWTLTEASTLSAIKGAQLDVNATTGTIDVIGQNVNIVGNQSVNISGPSLNFNSLTTNNNRTINSGIHMIATSIVNNTETQSTTVDITSDGITMAASNGIIFKSGKGINFWTSDSNNTSVLKIDKDDGIYLGSSKSIKFFSGTGINSNTSVEINKDKILFGVNSGSDATAIKMTQNEILLATGDKINNTNIGTGTAGVKITKDSIFMAIGTSSITSSLSIASSEIIISNNNKASGSFVSINQNGVFIGVANDNTGINSTNRDTLIKNAKGLSLTQAEQNYITNEYAGASFQVYTPNFIVTKEGKLYTRDAYLSGTIEALNGKIANWNISKFQLDSGSGSNFVALNSGTKNTTSNSADYNPYGDYAIWAGAADPTSTNSPPKFSVTKAGSITVKSGIIGGWNIDSDSIWTGTKANNDSIRLSSVNFSRTINGNNLTTLRLAFGQNFGLLNDGSLYASSATISGNITATSGIIGNCVIEGGTLKVGSANITSIDASVVNSVNISADSIQSGTLSGREISGGSINIGNGTFSVNTSGILTATGATIGGSITATSLIVGDSSTTVMTYSSSNGLNIGNTTNYLTYTSSGLTIKGAIYADSGNIGGCTFDSNGILKVGSANITSIDASLIQAIELSANKITSGTLSGRSISGCTITSINDNGSTITIDNGAIILDKTATIVNDNEIDLGYNALKIYFDRNNLYLTNDAYDIITAPVGYAIDLPSQPSIDVDIDLINNYANSELSNSDIQYIPHFHGYSEFSKTTNWSGIKGKPDNYPGGCTGFAGKVEWGNVQNKPLIDTDGSWTTINSPGLLLRSVSTNNNLYRFCVCADGIGSINNPSNSTATIIIVPNNDLQEVTHLDENNNPVHDYFYRTCTVYCKY